MPTTPEADAIRSVCEEVGMPFWLVDPRNGGCRTAFMNAEYFETLPEDKQNDADLPCQFNFQGGNNSEYSNSRCQSCLAGKSSTTCTISNRKDGTPFLSIQSMQPISVSKDCVLMACCQSEFGASANRIDMRDHANKLTQVLGIVLSRQVGVRIGTQDLDTVYLKAILLRFECAYTRLKNGIIRAHNARWQSQLESLRKRTPSV